MATHITVCFPQDVRLSTPIMAANGKTMNAKTVFAQSLEHFLNLAKTEVPLTTGVPWKDDEVKWVLTVPAIWGDRAKDFMRKAAMEVSCSEFPNSIWDLLCSNAKFRLSCYFYNYYFKSGLTGPSWTAHFTAC